MTIYMLWHGGHSWGAPDIVCDTETFPSLGAARRAFKDRADGDPYYPCVDADATAQLFFYDPRTVVDPYPDRVLSFGPRGGVRMEQA